MTQFDTTKPQHTLSCMICLQAGKDHRYLPPQQEHALINAYNQDKATIKELVGWVKDLRDLEAARLSSHGLKNYPRPSYEYLEAIDKVIAQAEARLTSAGF